MPLLDKLERHLGRFAIPGLPLILVAGQALAWFGLTRRILSPEYVLFRAEDLDGHTWWRMLTFLFCPPSANVILALFAWWMFYFFGNALEGFWGTFRFNLFVFLGWAFTVGAGFLYPHSFVTNLFLGLTVFLAFAYLNPDFEISIFLILPIQVRWLAILSWAGLIWLFITGSAGARVQIAASVANFFLFFGRDVYLTMRLRGRTMKADAARLARSSSGPEARHQCRICGKTDVTHPEMDFRYCSRCVGDLCYCQEHIFNHEHVTVEDEKKA